MRTAGTGFVRPRSGVIIQAVEGLLIKVRLEVPLFALENDPQVVGGACVKQGLQSTFEHTWRWNTQVPMWQSLEEFDPWVVFPQGARVRDVTFERKFRDAPDRLTVVIVPGRTHNPLNHEDERQSLSAWLDRLAPKVSGFRLDGVNYEAFLPDLQERLRPRGQP